MTLEKHVLGLSGGKDSAALALYMAQSRPELDIEYFFTDTGNELPEVYDFLSMLEAKLGKPIQRLNPKRDFEFWLRQYKNFLPSAKTRWCTRQLKIKPFEAWIKPTLAAGGTVYSYVAIRADENRQGYVSEGKQVVTVFPLSEAGVDLQGVDKILSDSGIGKPAYYNWRSRSGCTFCFYQRKIEWVRLKERHPDAFEYAKSLEKNALEHGSPFTWSDRESLEDLEKPERVQKIQKDHEKQLNRVRRSMRNPLIDDAEVMLNEIEISKSVCISCHK